MARKLEIVAPPAEPVIFTERVVDAPRSLVYEAFTRTEHIVKWLGPHALTIEVTENDLRVGGRYRFVHRAPDGAEFAFHGVYKELSRPARIVRTFVFEGAAGFEVLETLSLEEKDGKTTISTTSVHPNLESRDAHLKHGMEQGMTEGYERLDQLLDALRRAPANQAHA